MIVRILLAAIAAFAIFAPVVAQDAPFGFAWGPVGQVPKPWTASREGNITTLFYDSTSAVVSGVDTDQVIVEVCKSEGLQEIIWISRELPQEALQRKFQLIHQQGVARYGEAKQLATPMSETWKDGRVFLGITAYQQRLVMFMRGALFDKCSAEHEAQSGHPASQHVDNLLRRPY